MVAIEKDQLSLDLGTAGIKYDPKFDSTEKTELNLKDIEREQWTFERLIIDPKYEGWLRRRAFIRSGHHTLHIEGNRLTEDQVAEILGNPIAVIAKDDSQQVGSWNQAMQFVDSVSTNSAIPISSLLIQHINQLMLGKNDRQYFPGEYRRGESRVRHPISRKPVYRGPPAGDVPDLMHQFGNWLGNGVSAIHPVLAAGIAHLRLVEIHPFTDGNGRTARALTTLMLQRYGYPFNRLLAFERYFDIDLLNYCEAISATVGSSFEEGRNLTVWLEYFTFALSVEVGLASDAVVDLRRMMEKWHSVLSKKGYVERHRDILAYAYIHNGIRPRDVTRIANVSAVTASNDLRRLTDAGLLTSQGYSRARMFRPVDDVLDKL